MEELGRVTGLSRTTLYRRTGGRQALLDALERRGAAVGDRTDVRARILEAARAVFSRTGFSAGTCEEIAREADVSAMTIYRQFGDKEGVAASVLEELAPRKAVRAARHTGDLRRDLSGLAEGALTGLRDETALVRWMFIETLQGGPFMPRVRELAPTRTLESLTRLFATYVSRGGLPAAADPELLAQAFAGTVLAFAVIGPVFTGRPAPDPGTTARTLTELFLRGALGARNDDEAPTKR